MNPDDPPTSGLWVPTATLPSEVAFEDGTVLNGVFFVPAHVLFHLGPMAPENRLNDETDFFPFHASGESTPILVNKRRVVRVTFGREPAAAKADTDEAPPSNSSKVAVECLGGRFEGALVTDTPGDKNRVLDQLNQPSRFLCIRSESGVHFVNRDHVTRVTEVAS